MNQCLNCGSNETYLIKGKYAQWYRYKDGSICHKCRLKLITNRKWNKLNRAKWNPRVMRFNNKLVYALEIPRTGYCSLCPNNIYDKSCERTSMHHYDKYYDDKPLKNTIEICNSCHKKLHLLMSTSYG